MSRFYTQLAAVSILLVWTFTLFSNARAQDTVRIDFDRFVEMAMDYSSNMDAGRQNIKLAENRIRQAQTNRILPNLNLTTAHGFVPGVKPSGDFQYGPGQYYLDPDLDNDWENWGVFTQAEISSIQPVYTWGGMSNMVNAARKGAEAARFEFDSEKEKFMLQLFELYQSALLAMELDRLMIDARSQLDRAERELEQMREEGHEDLEEKDIFEFYIFKEEFQATQFELQESLNFIRRTWDLALGGDRNTVYVPAEHFLDPVPVRIQSFDFYEHAALNNRAELKGIQAAKEAAEYGVDAARSQYYPSLVLGVSAGLGYTPNRPRQTNPFIRNTTNYMSARVGFGFRQNLNFLQTRTSVQRSVIQKRQASDFHDAARDGILLELSDRYREARITESRKESKKNALTLSNEWLRTEQIDFDIGFGNIKNLVDAVKKKMELELDVTELTFDLNMNIAKLHRSAGLPLSELHPVSVSR